MLENLKNALKSTVIYSIGNLSSKLLGLILIPLYTDKLTVSEYGILGMLEITAQIFTAVFGMSLYNAFFRWYWDKDYLGKQKSMFFTILVFVLALALRGYPFIPVMVQGRWASGPGSSPPAPARTLAGSRPSMLNVPS